MRRVARFGNLEILQYIMRRVTPPASAGITWERPESICAAAAAGGHLEVLRWLRAMYCDWDWETTKAAAESGHLHALQVRFIV